MSCCALNSMLPPSFSTTEDTLLWYSGKRALQVATHTQTHIHAYAHAHTAISLAHRSTWIIIIARSTSHRFNVWMNNILLGLQQIRTVKITTQQAPDFLLDHSYWAEKMTPFLTSHTLPQVIRFKIKNKSSGNLFQGREGDGRGTLTFLHCLERVVRLDKFHRVGDFLALQNVIAQTQVWDGKLENLVISYSVFFEYGTCWVKQ